MRALLEQALPVCRTFALSSTAVMNQLERLEVTIVSNRAIARAHDRFFDDPTPTDVITFPDGEILVGAGVVAENAKRFGHTETEEATICVIHGCLHLAGWDDQTAQGAKDMARKQEQIFKIARRMLCSPTDEWD